MIDIVFCHWNNFTELKKTITLFRKDHNYRFIIIDNSSDIQTFKKLESWSSKNRIHLYRRENTNREAGAYLYYIDNIFDNAKLVLFSQDEFHMSGMTPKGRENEKDFYSETYNKNEINLLKLLPHFKNNPYDLVGFGGRIEMESLFVDRRWFLSKKLLPIIKYLLKCKRYKFISGACFIVSGNYIQKFKEEKINKKIDNNWKYLAWYYERFWGLFAEYHNGKIYRYNDMTYNVSNKKLFFKTLINKFVKS